MVASARVAGLIYTQHIVLVHTAIRDSQLEPHSAAVAVGVPGGCRIHTDLLIAHAVGEPTIEEALDKALTKAARVVKHTVEATTDEITSELQEALKS